jgi:hypothetical protein
MGCGVRKTPCFAPFCIPQYTKTDQFTKTGSGQTQETTHKKKARRFCTGLQVVEEVCRSIEEGEGAKMPFCRHFILTMIILPRQARDKHMENSKKRCAFQTGSRFGT